MPLNYDNITAITRDMIRPELIDNIFSSNPLFERFKGRARKYSGGNSILVPLEYAKTGATGSYSGYDTLSTTPNEMFTDAKLEWKQCYSSISISGIEEAKNSGDNAVINLLASKVKNARRSLEDDMGTQVFGDGTGNDSKDIDGLVAAVDAGSNVATYGGILRSTYTWWQAGYTSWSATAISEYAYQLAFGRRTIGNNNRPDLAVTGQTIFDKTFSVLTDKQRFTDTGDTFKAGAQKLIVCGVPLEVDSHCVSTNIWVLNSNYLDLCTSESADFRFDPFAKPVDQDAKIGQIIWYGNLTNSNCRMHERIYGVDVTL